MVLSNVITSRIEDILKKNPQGMNVIQIARETGINRNTVGRYLENMLVSGRVEMRRFGMEKIYGSAQRVPISTVLSISSELVVQMDSNLRIIYANEPFLELVGTDRTHLLGKNIEYTPVAMVFDELFSGFIENIEEGVSGKAWSGEFVLGTKDIDLFCRITPTVFDDGRKGVTVILEDITARKHAEDALWESEATAHALINAPSDSVIVIDTKGRILALNEIAASRFGKRSDELVGVMSYDLLPEEVARLRRSLMAPVLEKKEMVRFEDERGGRWYETVAYPVLKESGEVTRIAIIASDITNRRRAEIEIRESEDRYRKLVEISPDAVIIHQEEKITYLNPAAMRLLGASQPGGIIGKNILDFIQPEFRDAVRKNIEKDLVGDTTPPIELNMSRVDGTPVIVEGRGVRTFIGGKPAVQVALRDITESKHAEEALRESEDRYRTLVEMSPDAVFLNQEGKITYANPATIRLLGASCSADITGREVFDFIQPEFRDTVRKNIEKDLVGEITPRTELHMVRTDGTPVLVEGRGVKTIIHGKPAIQVTLTDITERKHAEDALRESEATARALLNAPTDSVILLDTQGVILALNETAAKRFGKQITESVGVLADDLLPKEIAQSRRSLISQVLDTKKMVRFEDEHDNRWYDTVAYPVLNGTGDVTRIAVIARDITDRGRTEETLVRSEQRFRHLITAVGDIVWETDAQARFVYVSPQVETILGYTPDELIGHTPFEFLHHDTIPGNQKKLRTAAESQDKPILHESLWIHKCGHLVTIESNAIKLYDSSGSFSGFIGIDRKRL